MSAIYQTHGFLLSTSTLKQQVLFECQGGALKIHLIPAKTQIVYLPQGQMDTILQWYRHIDENKNIGTLDLDNPESQIKATFELCLENLIQLEVLLRGRQIYLRKPSYQVVEAMNQQIFRVAQQGTTAIYVEKMAFFPQGSMDFQSLSRLDQMRQEIEILVFLKEYPHNNIISLQEIATNGYAISIFLENCQGGDLLQSLTRNSDQINVPEIMRCILQGLSHLHQHHIVHRDIKLQNILLLNQDDWTSIKIADFGLSCHKSKLNTYNPRCGTPGYTAPEVFDVTSNYDEKVDIYSAGIILYNILTLKNPFGNSRNPQEIMQKNMSGNYDKTHLVGIVNSNPLAYDLLTLMLEKDSKKRPSAQQCLLHPFLQLQKDQQIEQDFNSLHINENTAINKVKCKHFKLKTMTNKKSTRT